MVLSSDFSKMNATERTAADFTRCTFETFSSDFYGDAVFSSISQLRLFDSHLVATANGSTFGSGTIFDFGVNSDCRSGCGPGQFGACEAVDGCFSCMIGACKPCPIGTYRTEPGAVLEAQCLPCPSGEFSEAAGAHNCEVCASGSYVTLLASEVDGIGTASRGETCVACPAGRETTKSGSIACSSCSEGKSSRVDEPCTECPKGTYAFVAGLGECPKCEPGKFAEDTGSLGCTACGAGTFSAEGAFACTDCEAGRATAVSGSATCSLCPAGKHSYAKSLTCTTCGVGTFSTEEAESCTRCDNGTVSSGGHSSMYTVWLWLYHQQGAKLVYSLRPRDTSEQQHVRSLPRRVVQSRARPAVSTV